MNKAVITVVGKDKSGIIYQVSKILAERNVNILDISQTILSDIFSMVTIVDIDNCTVEFDKLSDELIAKGNEIGVKITICHEDIFNAMHRI